MNEAAGFLFPSSSPGWACQNEDDIRLWSEKWGGGVTINDGDPRGGVGRGWYFHVKNA